MSDWEPRPAELRDGDHPDRSAHAARNLEQIRQGVEDGILDPEDLSPERRRQLAAAE